MVSTSEARQAKCVCVCVCVHFVLFCQSRAKRQTTHTLSVMPLEAQVENCRLKAGAFIKRPQKLKVTRNTFGKIHRGRSKVKKKQTHLRLKGVITIKMTFDVNI